MVARGRERDPGAMDVEKLTARLRTLSGLGVSAEDLEQNRFSIVRVQRRLAFAPIEQHDAAA